MTRLEGVIYKYTSPSGKVYVGQTINENNRQRNHKYQAKNPKDYFHRAIAKYGFDKFKYEVIFKTVSYNTSKMKLILDTMEVYFIKKYDTMNPRIGYNTTKGGDGILGHRHTDEARQKMKQSSPKQRPWMVGVERDKSDKIKIALTCNGGMLIGQFNKDKELIQTFNSVREASEAVGACRTSISQCLSGRYKTSAGFIWERIPQ